MISAATHASLPSKPPPPTERETRFWLFLGTALASEGQQSLLSLRDSLDRNPGGLVHRMGTDDAHPMHLPVIVDWVEATQSSRIISVAFMCNLIPRISQSTWVSLLA